MGTDRRNIPYLHSAGTSKHRFNLKSFFLPEGQWSLLPFCNPSPQLSSYIQVQRALKLLAPDMAKIEVEMVKLEK